MWQSLIVDFVIKLIFGWIGILEPVHETVVVSAETILTPTRDAVLASVGLR